MRCSECLFVCSDSRDICPRCAFDLRPLKLKLSLPITAPDASYKDLLAQIETLPVGCTPSTAAPKTLATAGLFATLRSIIAPPKKGPKTETKTATSPASPSVPTSATTKEQDSPRATLPVPKHTSFPPAKHPSGPKVIDLTNIEEDLDLALDQIIKRGPVSYETVSLKREHELVTLVLPQTSSFTDAERLLSKTCSEIASPPGRNLFGVELEEKKTEAPPPEQSAPEGQKKILPVGKTATELIAMLSAAEPTHSAVTTPDLVKPSNELACFATKSDDPTSAFYTAAAIEIEQHAPAEIELSFQQLSGGGKDEHLTLLFDLAEDFIKDPQKKTTYVEKIATSSERTVKAPAIEVQLRNIESTLDAPMFSLKSGSALAHPSEETTTESALPTPAHWKLRLKSALVDILSIMSVGVIITIFSFGGAFATFLQNLVNADKPDLVEILFPTALFLALLILLSIIYPLVALLASRQTIGSAMTGLHLISIDGRLPKRKQIVVRALSLPLSILSLGTLPAIKGGLSRHDVLSGTFFEKV